MAEESDGRSGDRNGSLPQEVAAGLREAGGLEGLRSVMPDEATLKSLAERHQALSDPFRLSIIYFLRGSELCPCVLKDITGLSDSKLSYHLSILEKAGMIVWRQNKNWRVYSLTDLGKRSVP
ncbi:MAG: metalloregulator ArsR/SmtB family transcription factor [Methanomassiliicoccales archaeon]|nr:metalloregulator ArsR/SmtB family transcription factor [Methanomassiliicoccales archaeon]TFG57354.1 MAG: ArsR family transcriptional regulator [Methanomassiliicoccus sp.]